MRRYCEENERIKRKYVRYLKDAKGCDQKTIDIVLPAIAKFEQATGFQNFKKFNLEMPGIFKASLERKKHRRTGKPLSKATNDGILRHVRTFFHWLAGEPGYKSRIKYSDVAYFNNNAKDARVAHAQRAIPFPTMEQCAHTFRSMPETTEYDRRNKAMFAFFMLTGARVGATASLKLKFVNLIDASVYQDAREVHTKAAKTFTSWFFPVDDMYKTFFYAWVDYLRNEKLYGHDDALFPKTEIGIAEHGGFEAKGLSRKPYANGMTISKIIKVAFKDAGLAAFGPHSFRKTLVQYGDEICKDWTSRKAWSMNLGHEHMATTITSYCPISQSQQAEIIKSFRTT